MRKAPQRRAKQGWNPDVGWMKEQRGGSHGDPFPRWGGGPTPQNLRAVEGGNGHDSVSLLLRRSGIGMSRNLDPGMPPRTTPPSHDPIPPSIDLLLRPLLAPAPLRSSSSISLHLLLPPPPPPPQQPWQLLHAFVPPLSSAGFVSCTLPSPIYHFGFLLAFCVGVLGWEAVVELDCGVYGLSSSGMAWFYFLLSCRSDDVLCLGGFLGVEWGC